MTGDGATYSVRGSFRNPPVRLSPRCLRRLRRRRDRKAVPRGASLHWRRGGSSRLHPVIPGSAGRNTVKVDKALAHAGRSAERRAGSCPRVGRVSAGRRQGARRVRRLPMATSGGVARKPVVRLSAPRLPRPCGGQFLVRGFKQNSDAPASRERDSFPSPPQAGGGN